MLRVSSLVLLVLAFLCDRSLASPVSLEEYRSSIQASISRVESEKGPLNSEGCAFVEDRFPPYLEVKTKSGEPVRVDNGKLLRLTKAAQEAEQGREDLVAHLKALQSQISFVDRPLPLSEDRWSESRALLERVFKAKEFQNLEEMKDPAWLVFLMELLKKVIDWLSKHSGAIQSSGAWIEYVFYGVMLGGLFVLLRWVLRTLGPAGWRSRDLKMKTNTERKASGMDWQALREESLGKENIGEYREAIRLFFLSVLMQGHERGWWVYRREATNREHLRGVEGSLQRREALRKMIQVYENAWYGHESPEKECFLQYAEWLRLIEAG